MERNPSLQQGRIPVLATRLQGGVWGWGDDATREGYTTDKQSGGGRCGLGTATIREGTLLDSVTQMTGFVKEINVLATKAVISLSLIPVPIIDRNTF